jgi:chemotaxis protein MotB
MFTLARRGRHPVNVWPAFVDALASILLVLVFMLLVFVLGRYILGVELAGRERALEELGRQVRALSETLALERSGSEALRSRLQATLAELESRTAEAGEARTDVGLLSEQVAALREQLAALNQALDATQAQAAAREAEIARLGERLNLALAKKAEELERYRSEFFGRLRALLGAHPSIRVVGDRFVFQSELLFPSGEAALTADGERRLAELARTLRKVTAGIPADIDWVLQVGGHTDRRPIRTAQFPSNWELSTARALSVVHFLAGQGIEPRHLAAAGYGEHYPIDSADSEDAWARNRRIEIKLTQP